MFDILGFGEQTGGSDTDTKVLGGDDDGWCLHAMHALSVHSGRTGYTTCCERDGELLLERVCTTDNTSQQPDLHTSATMVRLELAGENRLLYTARGGLIGNRIALN